MYPIRHLLRLSTSRHSTGAEWIISAKSDVSFRTMFSLHPPALSRVSTLKTLNGRTAKSNNHTHCMIMNLTWLDKRKVEDWRRIIRCHLPIRAPQRPRCIEALFSLYLNRDTGASSSARLLGYRLLVSFSRCTTTTVSTASLNADIHVSLATTVNSLLWLGLQSTMVPLMQLSSLNAADCRPRPASLVLPSPSLPSSHSGSSLLLRCLASL